MADINLLPSQERETVRVEGLRKRLQLSSILVLVVVAVLTILTLALFTYFAAQNSALVAQVEESSARVNQLKAQEELLVVVKDKTSTASTLVSQREVFPVFFEKLSALVPQSLYFTDMKVAEDEVVISGKARTSADVSGFVNLLLSATGAEIITSVSVDSLSADDSGIYTFVISGKLASAAVAPVSAAEDEANPDLVIGGGL